MLITLLHPSYGRPSKAFKALKHWKATASGNNKIQHILALDYRDSNKAGYLLNARSEPELNITLADSYCVVDATNRAAKMATGEVFVYMSDDFECTDGWDQQIVDFVNNNDLNGKPYLLRANDNYQSEYDVLTIPIMSRSLYEELGYFWQPEYKSMFVDNDLFHLTSEMGVLYDARNDIKFNHIHYTNPKINNKPSVDNTYKQSQRNWQQGEDKFVERCATMNWTPSNERLQERVRVYKLNNNL